MTRRDACITLGLAAAARPAQGQGKKLEVRGMYSHPRAFWEKGARLDEYGVNALFVHGASITRELMERAAAEGAKVYAEYPTLNGKGYVEKHPEAWPVNERGEKSPAATWFLGACPTEPGFRAWRLRQLEELLDRFDLAGVWMDYFHWHAQFEDPNPVLPETCFSETCVAAFQTASGTRVPAGAAAGEWILKHHERQWREWRVNELLRWAAEVKATVKKKRPKALLGVYHCPWTDDEFGGARRRILGLDLERLAQTVEVFSPMVYHGRMKRKPEWVSESVEWLSRKLDRRVRIWPIVQAHNEPDHSVSAAEFERVLRGGMSGAASGVMMFTAQSVAQDDAKMAAMRRVYREALLF